MGNCHGSVQSEGDLAKKSGKRKSVTNRSNVRPDIPHKSFRNSETMRRTQSEETDNSSLGSRKTGERYDSSAKGSHGAKQRKQSIHFTLSCLM